MSAPTPTIDELLTQRDLLCAQAHEKRAESYSLDARAAEVEAEIRERAGYGYESRAHENARHYREMAQVYRTLADRCRAGAAKRTGQRALA
ncbi:hypothetical protein [Algiphilus sp.]|uniref:hypothetical protein n=1 Tax=Algiphilus sp. TaxID=1872431 RepID=UPI0025BCF0F4|nr:hypothetical protein [Algiphilus sp.]MCK5769496.1 hypothetical protein [Algiphilus sp.]